MSIRTIYNNGVFDVFDGDKWLIHQPFKPTDTGSQEFWNSEEEALAWWAATKPPTTESTQG